MILADKIITLRKKSGWSQEELAQQLHVTRQSVSKWEGAQSIPDLDKILQMSSLFGVSTDYLLKDELEEVQVEDIPEQSQLRRVSMEEASSFLAVKDSTAVPVASATALCILSPVCLLLLGGAAETGAVALSENAAGGIGMAVLFLLIAAAVSIFISMGAKTKEYEYLESEPIETEYGVTGMVKERQKAFQSRYTRTNMLAAALCISAAVPIFAGLCISENDMFMVGMVCLTLLLIAVGVFLFIRVGIPWASMEKLLQEGDYTREKKAGSRITGTVSTIYWLVATAIYLGCSFITNDWKNTWIVWPIAGVLFAAVMAVCHMLLENSRKK